MAVGADNFGEIAQENKMSIFNAETGVSWSRGVVGTKANRFGDNLVTPCTKMQQSKSKVSPITPLNAVASYT